MEHKNTNNIKINCDLCKGIGLIKNTNKLCEICDGYKCEYFINANIEEFYPYKYCEFCEISNSYNSSPKKHCVKCLNKAFNYNKNLVCYDCKSIHNVCKCINKIIEPYIECSKCNGLGLLE